MESDGRAARKVGSDGQRQEGELQAGLAVMGSGCMGEVREPEAERVLRVPCHLLRRAR